MAATNQRPHKLPTKPYKPLSEQISMLGMESAYFSHGGKNFEILATNVKPHIHTIKNCETGSTIEMLHSRLIALSQS